MFQVKKILSSGSNVPDPCRMYTTPGTAYKIGSALTVTAGKLTNASATDTPLYIAAESAAADEKRTLVCYPIVPAMVFEVPIHGAPATVKCGAKVALSITNGFADKVSVSTTNGVATIVDMRGAIKSGDKISVRFA